MTVFPASDCSVAVDVLKFISIATTALIVTELSPLCRGSFSPVDSSVLEFFITLSLIFAATSWNPSPSFLLGGPDTQLNFAAVSN